MTAAHAPTETAPADAQLYIEVEAAADGRVAVLRLVGILNLYTAPVLAERVEAALKRGVWSLVVSLADLDHIDAEVGVGALLRALRRAQMGNGTLLLAEVPEQVRKAIKVRGLGAVLHVFLTEPLAVSFLANWRSRP